MSIIAISGKSGSGKDTVGMIIQALTSGGRYSKEVKEYLERYTGNPNQKGGFRIKKFAGKLKQIVSILTGIPVEDLDKQEVKNQELGKEWWYYKGENKIYPFDTIFEANTKLLLVKPTVRQILQELGTDLLRDQLHPNIWINSLFTDIDKELNIYINNEIEYKSDYVYSEPIFIKSLEGKHNLYKCCCGSEFKANKYKIKTKHTKSCGCYQKYRAGLTQFKDGRKGTRLWNIYNNMIQRCENKNHPRYSDYGGRGIIVSDEFKPYEKFKAWALLNGYKNTLSIDRIDNNDIYCPDNCKFSSDFEQVTNTRDRSDNSSGYRGVSKEKHKWRASIQIQGKQKFLGYFNTPEEASLVYEKAFLSRRDLYTKKQIKKGFIITDLRFKNELEAVKKRNGITIRIEREICPKCNNTDNFHYNKFEGDKGAYYCNECNFNFDTDSHVSETELDNETFDYIINNDSSIEDLIVKVKEILQKEQII